MHLCTEVLNMIYKTIFNQTKTTTIHIQTLLKTTINSICNYTKLHQQI